ncbi:MAG: HAD family hydrolase [SAR202 cluster bacterium]|nr:HAD family hydrolase [SAR202 cluster bacterium]|tara:strand:+ start:448 stop:1035 length:588 start_codon:yes stop_codon:yes gene_type:complete
MNRAVFLDRDGVINRLVHRSQDTGDEWDSPYLLSEIEIIEGVGEAIQKINGLGFLAIIVSNQPGVAKGKCDLDFLDKATDFIRSKLLQQNAFIDDVYYCLHHPDAVNEAYRIICECRKPKPGLLFQAAQDHEIDLSRSYMIGDRITDIFAAEAAGCEAILVDGVDTGSYDKSRSDRIRFEDDLLSAVLHILVRET